jgi:DNA polymerase-3 subunit alpha
MLWFSNRNARMPHTAQLFETEPQEYPLPTLQRNPMEDAYDEIELLGFPLCDPFQLAGTSDFGNVTAHELGKRNGAQVKILGYLITTKDTGTKGGLPMQFGTFYDRHGDVFDTVHFPDVARKYPFRGRGFYYLKGKVTEDFGVFAIEVTAMEKVPFVDRRMEKLEMQMQTQKQGVV